MKNERNPYVKSANLNIRVTPQEADAVQYCAERLGVTKTEVIIQGIQRIKAEVDTRCSNR